MAQLFFTQQLARFTALPPVETAAPGLRAPLDWAFDANPRRRWDGGASREVTSTGMRADYMPPELNDNQAVQDPHRIVRVAGSPEVLWCQHHNGICRSGDGGRRWDEITGVPVSSFGFAVAAPSDRYANRVVVPAEADQRRIPVGAALAVTPTTDGGKTSREQRDGLLQHHCYDLVYRRVLGRRRAHLADGIDQRRRVAVGKRRRAVAYGHCDDAAKVDCLLWLVLRYAGKRPRLPGFLLHFAICHAPYPP